MLGRFKSLLPALLLAAATLARVAPSVEAHALLDHADPPANSVVKQQPVALTLYFTQAVVPSTSWVMLRDSSGKDTDLKATPDGTKNLKATVPAVTPGTYTIRWQTQSADDDDYAQGSYKLTFANPDGSVPGAASSNSSTHWAIYGALVFGAVIVASIAAVSVIKRRKGQHG